MKTSDIIEKMEKDGMIVELEKDGIRITFIYYEVKVNYEEGFKFYVSELKMVDLYEIEAYKEYYKKRNNEMKAINKCIENLKKELEEKYESIYN